ncbi:MAG: methyltransferase domain-containing protein, partial [Acidobacteriota bacterium]
AGDINPHYLHYLTNFAHGKPYLEVEKIDLEAPADFAAWRESVEAVVCLNVLEHVRDPDVSLRNLHGALEPGGRVVLYVPQDPKLYAPLDEKLGHRCRYTREQLQAELEAAGFVDIELRDFNRFGRLGWWWNCKVRGRLEFGRVQLKIFDTLVPILRRIDRFWPWKGLGLIATARKPSTPAGRDT